MPEIDLSALIQSGDEVHRDAIHVAVVPVRAAHDLKPGQHVGLVGRDPDGHYRVGRDARKRTGVISPFLEDTVEAEALCWMLLYQNTVTSLRHDWTHPDFAACDKKEDISDIPGWSAKDKTAEQHRSEAWLRNFASELRLTYDKLLQVATEYQLKGDWHTLPFGTPDIVYGHMEEFWKHFECVTGASDLARGEFISCAC